MNKPNVPKLQQSSRPLSENAIRLNQIDAEITRLSKQLEYLMTCVRNLLPFKQ
jgi:hypothetical protein